MKTNQAAWHIGSANISIAPLTDEEYMKQRALNAVERGDRDLLAEWLIVHAPQRIETLKTLKKFGHKAMDRQLRWAVACEADLQEWMKRLLPGR